MKFTRISSRFLATLLPVFFVSLVLVSALSYVSSRSALQRDADTIGREVSDNSAKKLQNNLDKKESALLFLSMEEELVHGDKAQRMHAMQQIKDKIPDFAMIAFADLDGKAFDSTGKEMDRSDRDYFKTVKETKKPYMTAPMISGTTGDLISVIAYPVIDPATNELLGLVYGTMRLGTMVDLIKGVKFMETGYGFVIDQGGVFIVHRNEAYNGKLDLMKEESEGIRPDPALREAFKAALSSGKEQRVTYVASTGKEMQTVLIPFDSNGRRFVSGVTAPMDEIQAEADHLLYMLIGITLLALLGAGGVIIYFARWIARRLQTLLGSCERINSGDLSAGPLRITAEDEIGQLAHAFNKMGSTMHDLLKKISDNATLVATSSGEVNTAATQSADSAVSIAESVTEIAQGVAQQSAEMAEAEDETKGIEGNVGEISSSADAIAQITDETVGRVQEGRRSIKEIVGQMNQIEQGTQIVGDTIDELARESEEIKNIVELISSIAGQTNLLALNAAIEAARAGEAGRGFAVVAEEVRKLAEESESSSQKIAELVSKITGHMHRAVEAGEEGAKSVARGKTAVETADSVFTSINDSIAELSERVKGILENIRTTSDGIRKMSTSISTVKSVSDQNAASSESISAATQEQSASMEEIAAAAHRLSDLADGLQAEVAKFKL